MSRKNGTQADERVFALDGSGIIYAVTNQKKWNRVFRVAAVMNEEVQPELLERAVTDLRERFPTFFVQLDQDFFNYKLRTVRDTGVVGKEADYPCGHIDAGIGNKPMFRVLYYRNRISLEIFHILSDGSGAMLLLKNIVARYLELRGVSVAATDGVLDITENPSPRELEDSYQTVTADEGKKVSRKEAVAYRYKQPKQERLFQLTHGFLRVEEIKKLCKERGVTVTDYLAALYTWSFYQTMFPKNNKNPIKLSVPVDLRRFFGSETLRGFSLYVNTCLYPHIASLTFEDVLTEVSAQLKEGFKKENLAARVAANTAAQNSAWFRRMPLALKKAVLKIGYVLFGERSMTTAFTNLGVVKIPAGMEAYLDHFDFVAGGTLVIYINCAIATCNEVVNIIFSSRSAMTDVQRVFFAFLAQQGLRVDVQSSVDQNATDASGMLRCDSCGVNFADNHAHCPLCKQTGERNDALPLCKTAPYPEISF